MKTKRKKLHFDAINCLLLGFNKTLKRKSNSNYSSSLLQSKPLQWAQKLTRSQFHSPNIHFKRKSYMSNSITRHYEFVKTFWKNRKEKTTRKKHNKSGKAQAKHLPLFGLISWWMIIFEHKFSFRVRDVL